jgi:lysozyme family protein
MTMMTSNSCFATAFAFVLAEEGGYANDPDDPGGATNRGVTQRVYDAWRQAQLLAPRDVRSLTFSETAEIYRSYWETSGGEKCHAAGKYSLALVVMDWGVNGGVGRARRYLQAVLGVSVDGVLGVETLGALERLSTEQEAFCCDEFLQLRAKHHRGRCGNTAYVAELKAKRLLAPVPKANQVKFLKTWLGRVRRQARELELPLHELYTP